MIGVGVMRGSFGPLWRMCAGLRVEGDCDRAGFGGFGASNDVGDDHAVAAVDAVEVSDGDDGWLSRPGKFLKGAVYLHYAFDCLA